MAAQPDLSFTFHKLREQCEQGSPDAWRAFLDFYTPLALHLLRMYPPNAHAQLDHAQLDDLWQQTLLALARNDFERFRTTERQSEREFLAEIRALLLEQALQSVNSEAVSPDSAEPPLTPDAMKKLLEGLPLLHQEMLFLKLAGYTDQSIERMLRMAPHVAKAAFARLAPEYEAALNIQIDRCLWPHQWLLLLKEARSSKKEDCPKIYQFLRIHDGQVSWYDKEPTEKHVSGCLHCLEVCTALREVGYWRKAAPPANSGQIEKHLSALPLTAPKKSFLKRMFG